MIIKYVINNMGLLEYLFGRIPYRQRIDFYKKDQLVFLRLAARKNIPLVMEYIIPTVIFTAISYYSGKDVEVFADPYSP